MNPLIVVFLGGATVKYLTPLVFAIWSLNLPACRRGGRGRKRDDDRPPRPYSDVQSHFREYPQTSHSCL